MLDSKKYNIKSLKKMKKANFFKIYKGKIANIELVWTWLQKK